MKKTNLHLWLFGVLLCGMTLTVTSCNDDANDSDGYTTEESAVEEDKHSDEALSFLTCVNLLCGISELPDNWRTTTYTPTIGTVTDESRPTVSLCSSSA